MGLDSLSSHAFSILKSLAAGTAAIADGEDFRVGRKRMPAALVRELERRDLIARTAEGLIVSEPGLRLLRRVAKTAESKRPTGTVDGFRRQHMTLGHMICETPEGRARTLVNQTESPLGWLMRRRGKDGTPLLDRRQVEAGERLREDFERAALGSRITAAYDPLPVTRRRGGIRFSEPGLGATHYRDRVQRALAHVGPGLSDILIRTCCHLEGLEEAERGLGWPARSAKLVLGIALDRLADHYEGAGQKKRSA